MCVGLPVWGIDGLAGGNPFDFINDCILRAKTRAITAIGLLVTGVEVSVVIRLFGSKDSTALNRLLRRGGAPSTRLRFETWEKEDGQVAR